MGVDGRIGNRAMLQALADALQMEGVNRMPAALNIDQVQVMVDLFSWSNVAQPNYGAGAPFYWVSGDVSLAGQSTYREQLIQPGLIEPGYMRIVAVIVEVQFDAAGATAFDGKYLNLEIDIGGYDGDPPIPFPIIIHRPWTQVRSGEIYYPYSMAGWSQRGAGVIKSHLDMAWDGAIYGSDVDVYSGETLLQSDGPQGMAVTVGSADLTVFPVNTKVNFSVIGRRSTNGLIPTK